MAEEVRYGFIGAEVAQHRHRQKLKIEGVDAVVGKADSEREGSVIAVEESNRVGWALTGLVRSRSMTVHYVHSPRSGEDVDYVITLADWK